MGRVEELILGRACLFLFPKTPLTQHLICIYREQVSFLPLLPADPTPTHAGLFYEQDLAAVALGALGFSERFARLLRFNIHRNHFYPHTQNSARFILTLFVQRFRVRADEENKTTQAAQHRRLQLRRTGYVLQPTID